MPSPAAADPSPPSCAQALNRPFSILTWNVWFGSLRQRERYAAIVREVLARDVDVSCFQEVTAPFVAALTSSEAIMAKYDLSPNQIYSYGCLTIVKKMLKARFTEATLPTRMDRTLILAQMDGITVGNVHLESLDSEDIRGKQLREAREAMRAQTTAVLCGDFNFDATKTYGDWRRSSPARKPEELENGVLRRELSGWVDAWPKLKGGDPGLTFDGATNPVCVRDRREQMRYDRIMIKGSSFLSLGDISLVGTEPLDDSNLKPSDHYGIHISFTLGTTTVAT